MFKTCKKPPMSIISASGDICSFKALQAGIPLKSHTVDIDSVSGVSAINIGSDAKYAGFINFNQIITGTIPTSETQNDVTLVNNGDGTYTISGTATANTHFFVLDLKTWESHKFLLYGAPLSASNDTYTLRIRGADQDIYDVGHGCMWSGNQYKGISITVWGGVSINTPVVFKPQFFDLTEMFGQTKADEIYNMEQQTAGSGVAYFRSLFPNDYYAYNAGTLTTVSAVNGSTNSFFTIPIGQTVNEGVYNARTGVLEVTQPSVQTLQLPPCRVETLLGVNNIFADCGSTSIEAFQFGR